MKKLRVASGDLIVDHEAQPEEWPVERTRLRSKCLIEGLRLTNINQGSARTIDILVLNDLGVVVVDKRIRERGVIENRSPQQEHNIGPGPSNLHCGIMLKTFEVSSSRSSIHKSFLVQIVHNWA